MLLLSLDSRSGLLQDDSLGWLVAQRMIRQILGGATVDVSEGSLEEADASDMLTLANCLEIYRASDPLGVVDSMAAIGVHRLRLGRGIHAFRHCRGHVHDCVGDLPDADYPPGDEGAARNHELCA